MRLPLILTLATGCLLHAYTLTFKAEGGWSLFVLALFAFSLTPYAVSATLARFGRTVSCALGFAAGALVGDTITYYSVFIAPQSSTAALGLLVMPAWNLILLGPIGALISWASARIAQKMVGRNVA
jgi:hypothetical protein